ncbi:MAG: GNAT family N-acetyltransferase [Tannerellaceae bacterium]|nr:GNAT family N-acetyltransferase [Tannerellaceae bacterium]
MEIIKIQDIDLLVLLRFAFLSEMISIPEDDRYSLESNFRCYCEKHLRQDDFVALGVCIGSEIVSCGFLVVDERPASPAFPNGLTGTVLNVYTYPEHQRKGYGQAVIEAIIKESKERNLSVLTLSATEAGKRLYDKLGFTEPGYTEMKLKMRE